jgi:hypothetical protein
MRYAIAILVAAGIITGVKIHQRWVRATVEAVVRQQLREAQAEGRPEAAGIDPDNFDPSDVGTELPDYLLLQIQIAELLAGLWFIWMPIVFAGCLLAAWLISTPDHTRDQSPQVKNSTEV